MLVREKFYLQLFWEGNCQYFALEDTEAERREELLLVEYRLAADTMTHKM